MTVLERLAATATVDPVWADMIADYAGDTVSAPTCEDWGRKGGRGVQQEMTLDTDEIEQAVEQRRSWLQSQLDMAAAQFGVELAGEAVNTFDMRSAGATVRDGDQDVWLRVVVEDPDYQPACRWDGNVDANSIRGVPKPEVLRWADWHHCDSYLAGRRLRGEVMTLAPGSTIAPGGVLFDDPYLPESWWADLSAALGVLAAHPVNMDHELGAVHYTINGVRQHFGVTLTENTFAGLH